MKKTIFLFAMLFLTLLCGCSSSEGDEYPVSEGLKFTSNGDGTCFVAGKGTCTDARVVIPSVSPEGDTVVAIGQNAFAFNLDIVSITLPETITHIGSNAFNSCYRLYEVINHSQLPLDTDLIGRGNYGCIGKYAKDIHSGKGKIGSINGILFYKMDGEYYVIAYDGEEAKLDFPESYKGNSYNIFDGTFERRQDITSISFPDNAKIINIGKYAFRDCFNIAEIKFGMNTSLESIGEESFGHCSSFEHLDLSVANKLTTIEKKAFSNCYALVELKLPPNATNLGEGIFFNCHYLEKIIFAEDSKITAIPPSTFDSCERLKKVKIPEGITEIGSEAFRQCGPIESITLPTSIERIGESAFYHVLGTKYKIYYAGSEKNWKSIEIETDHGNDYFFHHLEIHYNYVEEE